MKLAYGMLMFSKWLREEVCTGIHSTVCLCWYQAKASLEKSKQQLETQNAEMDAELKQVSSARQESDRKRKQAEQQLQEVSLRLAELDKSRGDLGEKASKCQVCCCSTWCCFSLIVEPSK